jgi:hypothetical protein
MNIDVSQPLIDYAGNPVVEQQRDQGILIGDPRTVTLRDIILTAVEWQPPDEPANEADKLMAFKIGCKMYSDDKVNFTIDELHFIKRRSGTCGITSGLAHGRIMEALGETNEDQL